MRKLEIEITRRNIYLEDKLSKLNITKTDNKLNERELNILFTKLRYEDDETLSLKDLEYLVNAYLMPFDEIEKAIERYDSSFPSLDELLFVRELAEHYNVDRHKIIKRIQEVRKINELKKREEVVGKLYTGSKETDIEHEIEPSKNYTMTEEDNEEWRPSDRRWGQYDKYINGPVGKLYKGPTRKRTKRY